MASMSKPSGPFSRQLGKRYQAAWLLNMHRDSRSLAGMICGDVFSAPRRGQDNAGHSATCLTQFNLPGLTPEHVVIVVMLNSACSAMDPIQFITIPVMHRPAQVFQFLSDAHVMGVII